MTETLVVAPILKSVHVACTPGHAFRVFTRELGSWWPLESHARNPGEVREIVWEEREGGEVYEISTSGEKAHWATVLSWEPPSRFTIAWHVDPDAAAPTEVDVRFVPTNDGTRVDLEHRHWERLGATGAGTRKNYDGGWETVLGRFVSRAG